MRIRRNVIINYWLPYRNKLENLESFYCIHKASKFYLRGVSISNFTGDKIVTKNFNYEILNSHTKKYGMSRYFSSLVNTTIAKYSISY
jgi:hypothetical protein